MQGLPVEVLLNRTKINSQASGDAGVSSLCIPLDGPPVNQSLVTVCRSAGSNEAQFPGDLLRLTQEKPALHRQKEP